MLTRLRAHGPLQFSIFFCFSLQLICTWDKLQTINKKLTAKLVEKHKDGRLVYDKIGKV